MPFSNSANRSFSDVSSPAIDAGTATAALGARLTLNGLVPTGAVAITNSLGLVSSNPFTNAEAFTSLAGIVYPPSS